jgi:hypothetical protein
MVKSAGGLEVCVHRSVSGCDRVWVVRPSSGGCLSIIVWMLLMSSLLTCRFSQGKCNVPVQEIKAGGMSKPPHPHPCNRGAWPLVGGGRLASVWLKDYGKEMEATVTAHYSSAQSAPQHT